MTAPRTRLDEGRTDFERELLRSWEREEPSGRARLRVAALVGAATVLGGSSVASAALTAGAEAAASAAATSLLPKAASVGVLAAAKWIAAIAVVATATGVTVHYARPASPEASSPPAVVAKPSLPSSSHAPQPPLPRMASPSSFAAPEALPTISEVQQTQVRRVAPDVGVPESAPAAIAAAPPSTSAGALHAVANPTSLPVSEESPPALALREQVAALDRARDALAAGESSRAIGLVDEYDRRFPNGILAQEATTLRVEALLKQGDRSTAKAIGNRFLASYPTSPHAARIQMLLRDGSKE